MLLEKPVIDTLYLSPLAFPKNPYHRLVKDYKLVRDTLNDPVADARLALQIFSEQLIALQALPLSQLQLYQYLFDQGVMAQFNTQGLSLVFARLTGRPPVRVSELPTLIKSIAHEKACPNQLNRVIGDALRQPMLLLPLAYACAWLPVSGGNSVLPPWIWRRFPRPQKSFTQFVNVTAVMLTAAIVRRTTTHAAICSEFSSSTTFATCLMGHHCRRP